MRNYMIRHDTLGLVEKIKEINPEGAIFAVLGMVEDEQEQWKLLMRGHIKVIQVHYR